MGGMTIRSTIRRPNLFFSLTSHTQYVTASGFTCGLLVNEMQQWTVVNHQMLRFSIVVDNFQLLVQCDEEVVTLLHVALSLDNIAGTSGNSSTRHDDRAGTPNGPHRIESPDHRGQIRSVQRPRARACGGQEKTTSWDICERRLLAENYGETQRTSPQNDESTRRREDRLPVV